MFSSARPSAPSCLLCTDQSDLTSALFSAPSRQLSLKCSFITSFSHLCHLSVLPPYYPSFLSFCPFPSTLPLSPVLTVKRTPPDPSHSHTRTAFYAILSLLLFFIGHLETIFMEIKLWFITVFFKVGELGGSEDWREDKK